MEGLLKKWIEEAEGPIKEEYDVLVIGGGIAGMQSSLDLGDMGYKVLLIEKEPSIGGKMFLLSKTFPTLDCASCISTPKMAAVSHHPNIKLMTYTEVLEVYKEGEGNFRVKLLKKPRYVEEDLCTGCAQCELKCPVILPKEFDFGLAGRKAIYIPFPTAVPKKALIDIEHCILCGQCERICPANAVNFLQKPKLYEVKVKAVIIATGYKLFPAELKKDYHFGEYPNVITAMQMDRLLAPTRPYHTIVRPSDGKEPENIAYILCIGSRDKTVGNPNCSQICCMYSIKQAQLLTGALPLADITIYYIDIRAFGKGFEEFYKQTEAMGVNFIKGRVAKIEQLENGDLKVYYEDIQNGGKLSTAVHDLVVLAVGLLPNSEIIKVFKNVKIETDDVGWIKSPNENTEPTKTTTNGVFAAGCITGPKDIPDSIAEASAVAIQVAGYINSLKNLKR